MILAYSQKNWNYQLNYFGSVSLQFFLNKLFSFINGTGFGDEKIDDLLTGFKGQIHILWIANL